MDQTNQDKPLVSPIHSQWHPAIELQNTENRQNASPNQSQTQLTSDTKQGLTENLIKATQSRTEESGVSLDQDKCTASSTEILSKPVPGRQDNEAGLLPCLNENQTALVCNLQQDQNINHSSILKNNSLYIIETNHSQETRIVSVPNNQCQPKVDSSHYIKTSESGNPTTNAAEDVTTNTATTNQLPPTATTHAPQTEKEKAEGLPNTGQVQTKQHQQGPYQQGYPYPPYGQQQGPYQQPQGYGYPPTANVTPPPYANPPPNWQQPPPPGYPPQGYGPPGPATTPGGELAKAGCCGALMACLTCCLCSCCQALMGSHADDS